jgi:hypothetical protein
MAPKLVDTVFQNNSYVQFIYTVINIRKASLMYLQKIE